MPYVKVYDPALDRPALIQVTSVERQQLESSGHGIIATDELPDLPVISRVRTKGDIKKQRQDKESSSNG